MNNKIKKLIIIVIALIIILAIGFLVYNKIKKSYDVEAVTIEKYFLLNSDNNIGVIDNKGNIIIKPQYFEVHIPNPSKPIFVCYYGYNEQTGEYKTKIINDQGTELFTKYNKIETINLNDIATSMPYHLN